MCDLVEEIMEKGSLIQKHKKRASEMSEKFYAVWRKTGGLPPQKRHETKVEAITEACRLARQTEKDYYVLEVIGKAKPIILSADYEEIK